MRFGKRSIMLVDRQRRSIEYFRHYSSHYTNYNHFLGMFPSELKPLLVEAMKPEEYFQVVDLGKEFCGVYSKVRGSCFRLDEFERVEDYFFVCLYEDLGHNTLYSFFIFPFRFGVVHENVEDID